MANENIHPLQRETYTKMIENSLDSRMFNSLFVKYSHSDRAVDVCNDGEYSCAFFVSSVLVICRVLGENVATVASLLKKCEELFIEIKDPSMRERGDIVFWEKVMFENGKENEHVGFVFDQDHAVCTSYLVKKVVKESIDFKGTRKIERVFRPKFLS